MAGSPKQITDIFAESFRLAFTDQGAGRAFLLLHGGAGPASMAGLADALAEDGRAVVPTHPGFNGEPRPDWFTRIDDLVLAYLVLLEKRDLSDVVVVGNSVGGWIAAEMALRNSPRVLGAVLLNAVGIAGSDDHPIADPTQVPPAERGALSFHDPARFALVPAGPEAATAMANNQQALRVYAGQPFMYHPTLQARLAHIATPTLVIWGESDKIVDVTYGERYAASIPHARFERVAEAGHFPQIEQRDTVVQLIRDWSAQL